ncbi:MAG: GNAT family N-acetyltransferase [Bdellovibrionota bacterium]
MKLYRHYKNKPYTYVGLARHSETLEEMVIYETRYENSGGRVWVRPKQMFFESIDLNGKATPRFLEVPLKINTTTDITEADIQIIAPLIEKSFGQWDSKWFYSTFNKHKKFHLIIASIENQPAGFKIGYEKTPQEFYSWLGAVLPDFRGLGIASDLMQSQHEWCRKQDYTKIQTKTQNRFQAMLLLNIKNGFEIISTDPTDKDGMKILMEKRLI